MGDWISENNAPAFKELLDRIILVSGSRDNAIASLKTNKRAFLDVEAGRVSLRMARKIVGFIQNLDT